MPISYPVLGSDRHLGPISYIFLHCIPTGFQSFREAFYNWGLLMKGDISDYRSFNFLSEEEKYEQVYLDFWYALNESEVLDREDLNMMHQMMKDAESGKIQTVPYKPLN